MLYNYSRHTQKNSDVYHLFIPVHTHTHTHTQGTHIHTHWIFTVLHLSLHGPYIIIVTRLVYMYNEAFDNPIVKTS